MISKNKLPTMAIAVLYLRRYETISEKKLLKNTKRISLNQTPATKLNPPFIPLFILCLMMVKITGPTDKARKKPKPSPLRIDAVKSNVLR